MDTSTTDSVNLIRDFLTTNKDVWFESSRGNDTGIGKTLEDLLGKEEDNLSESDFDGLELKTKRVTATTARITLFTKTPSKPRSVSTYLRKMYGAPKAEKGGLKTLYTTIYGNHKNTFNGEFQFKVETDVELERLYLKIYDMNDNCLNKKDIYWDYQALKKTFDMKLQSVGFVSASTKRKNGLEHFKYEGLKLLLKPSFENFIKCIDDGLIVIDIRISVNNRTGATRDHGTGFRIYEKDLTYLYDDIIEISI